MVELQTVIFVGCAGSGKGTQAAMLKQFLERADPTRPTHHITTGEKFREFASTDKLYAQQRVREILNSGGLMPAFLPIWIWSGMFIELVQNNEHLLLDGFPRRPEEGTVLDSALTFFGRKMPHVVVLDAADEVIMARLIEHRKRHDDTKDEIKRRLEWYRSEVVPTLEFFRTSAQYVVHDVDANHPVEEIHADITHRLGLS